MVRFCILTPFSFSSRLVKAIENLQCFTLSADPSFRHFHLDATKEVKLIQGLEFIRGRLLCFCDKNHVKVKLYFITVN